MFYLCVYAHMCLHAFLRIHPCSWVPLAAGDSTIRVIILLVARHHYHNHLHHSQDPAHLHLIHTKSASSEDNKISGVTGTVADHTVIIFRNRFCKETGNRAQKPGASELRFYVRCNINTQHTEVNTHTDNEDTIKHKTVSAELSMFT